MKSNMVFNGLCARKRIRRYRTTGTIIIINIKDKKSVKSNLDGEMLQTE